MNMQKKRETNERDFLCWIEPKNKDAALMKEILRAVTHTETQYRNNKKALKTQLKVSRHVISKVRVDGLVSEAEVLDSLSAQKHSRTSSPRYIRS